MAVAAALHFAENGDRGVVNALGSAALAALALGVVLGVFVVVLHVPGWAASLGAALVVIVFIQQRGAPVDVQGAYEPTDHAIIIFGGFAAVAVLGGLFGSVKAVRRAVGRFRPVADPARRRGTVAAALTAGLIALSMPMAAVAGVLIAAAGSGPVVPDHRVRVDRAGAGRGAARRHQRLRTPRRGVRHRARGRADHAVHRVPASA